MDSKSTVTHSDSQDRMYISDIYINISGQKSGIFKIFFYDFQIC